MKRSVRVDMRVKPDEVERWRAVADRMGLSLSAWIRMTCNAGPGVLDVKRTQPREER